MTSRTEFLNSSMDEIMRRHLEEVVRLVTVQVTADGGSAADALFEGQKARLLLGLGSPGTESSSSTSLVSSPRSVRSGTSSRSLPGLTKSWLAGCLPSLLAATSESIRNRLVLSSASSGKGGTSRP
jgi:hypothetical protein